MGSGGGGELRKVKGGIVWSIREVGGKMGWDGGGGKTLLEKSESMLTRMESPFL
jgi:hypothetical protein